MGFIGSHITPIPGIDEDDLTAAYYVIDGINYHTNEETEEIIIDATFSIYPSKQDRVNRIESLGKEVVSRSIARSQMTGDILPETYIYSKPLLLSRMEDILRNKLTLETTVDIPQEYSGYHTLLDDV
jgi:hypothetical protein